MRIPSLVSSILVLLFTTGGPVFAGDNTHAEQAVQESAQASGNASASAAHSIVASGQVTSAASAVPLSVGGAVLGSAGAVSAGAAHDSMKAATAPIGTPLEVTDESITTMPPNEALKTKNDKQSDKKI
jgi:hypothetical protein